MRSLKVALVGGPIYDQLYLTLADFEQSSGIRVEVAHKLPYDDLQKLLTNLAATGELDCDLVSAHTKYAPSQAHFLLDLDELIEPGELEDFYPSVLDLCRFNDRLLQLPQLIDVQLLHARADLIAAVGADVPATFDELVHLAAELNRPPDRYGFAFPGQLSGLFGTFYELLASAGGDLFDPTLAPTLNTDAGAWALGTLRSLYDRGLVPPDTPDCHYDEVDAALRTGRAAMIFDWPGYYADLRAPESSVAGDLLDLAHLPLGPAGVRAAYAGCHSWAIPTTARDVPAATELLRFLVGHRFQLLDAEQGSVPVRASVAAEIRSHVRPGGLDERRLDLLDQAVREHLLIPPKFATYPAVEDVLWTTLQRAIIGALPVEAALVACEDAIGALTDNVHYELAPPFQPPTGGGG